MDMSFLREAVDLNRYFSKENTEARKITFYAESAVYYRYFKGYIQCILDHSTHDLCYISSETTDPIFKDQNPRIRKFFLSKLFPYAGKHTDARALLYVMDDLHQMGVKRSFHPHVNHIYTMHTASSTMTAHREGAFDFYDTIFCIGPYQQEEIRAREKKYSLPAKALVEVGYPYLDEIYKEQQKGVAPQEKTILVAPSWHEGNLFETCMRPLVQSLLEGGWRVIVRPHAEHVKRNKEAVLQVGQAFGGNPHFQLELDLQNSTGVQRASLLVTDWSGISFEWAFARERPVLFVNTKMKTPNKNYAELGIIPMEVQIREQIGVNIALEVASQACTYADALLENKEHYLAQIRAFREKILYNFTIAAKVGGEYILSVVDAPLAT
jgi:YidC/Oxa1 family membrane protein insertase